jgi:hypothetical protein
MVRALLSLPFFALASACISPHTVAFGTTARPVGAGAAEMSISSGIGYQAITQSTTTGTPPATSTISTTTRNLAIPAAEANVEYGVADAIGLNVHVSPAGIQPGAKFSLGEGGTRFAVLPALALGYASWGTSNTTTTQQSTTTTDTGGLANINFMFGVKLLAWNDSGFYGGFSLDYQRIAGDKLLANSTTPSGTVITSFNVGVGVGYELTAGIFRLRPEIALAIIPTVNTWAVSGATSAWSANESQFLLFPNLTVALASGSAPAAPVKENPPPPPPPSGMKPDELNLPPSFNN